MVKHDVDIYIREGSDSKMSNVTIFVGNGINRANSSYSWSELLNNLVRLAGKEHIINPEYKPFPLLYEEIYLRGLRFSGISETELKKYIANEVSKIEKNIWHQLLAQLEVDNIITTNYDYKIEESLGIKTNSLTYKNVMGEAPENKYRLHTYNDCTDKRIWHIHGEIRSPQTIVLGHEHYSNTLRRMIGYVSKNLLKRTKNDAIESWIDLFFNSDMYIFGFGFDYTEIDIWWLLNIRARLKNEKKMEVNNKIVYYSPLIINNQIDDKEKRRREVLFSHEVDVVTIEALSYTEFYHKVLAEIMAQLDNTVIRGISSK